MRWKLVSKIAVGGLLNVGFVPNSKFLIVVSSNGRGIFDCSNGEKPARDSEDVWSGFDDATGMVKGFDFLTGQEFKTSGLFCGDKLPKETEDGWILKLEYLEIILFSKTNLQENVVRNCIVCELRTFGFSDDHNYFVVATSCDLWIYKRGEDD